MHMDTDFLQGIRDQLDGTGYVDLKSVHCTVEADNVIVLTGRVRSFFMKQVAQEAVLRGLPNVGCILKNLIDVEFSS